MRSLLVLLRVILYLKRLCSDFSIPRKDRFLAYLPLVADRRTPPQEAIKAVDFNGLFWTFRFNFCHKLKKHARGTISVVTSTSRSRSREHAQYWQSVRVQAPECITCCKMGLDSAARLVQRILSMNLF